MKRLAIVVALAAALIAAPLRASAATRYVDEIFAGIEHTLATTYATTVQFDGTPLQLDMYEPAGDTNAARAVFIWAHGGFFTEGHKGQGAAVREFMTKRGWVTISIDYRLDPRLPEGVAGYAASEQLPLDLARLGEAARNAQHDMQAAVRWVRANAATHNLDPDRIAVGGFSAGGTMAVDTAWNSDDPGNSGHPGYPSNVAAAVAAGPTNFVFLDAHPDALVEPPVANYHWQPDEAPKETQQIACLVAKLMLNVCEVHAYAGAGHSSTVGMHDWLPFLYKWVVQKTKPPLSIAPGTLPTIPAVHVPSAIVPTLPGVPII